MCDQGQIAAVPAERRRTVGLMAAELGNRLSGAVVRSQHHRGAPPKGAHHGQKTTVATESGILLGTVKPGIAGPFHPATAAHQAGGQQDQQGRSEPVQSSKRELLSRGRGLAPLRELRGAGRLPFSVREDSGRPLLKRSVSGRLGSGRVATGRLPPVARRVLKAASSASGRAGRAAVVPRSLVAPSTPEAALRPVGRLPRRWSSRWLRRSPK